MKKGLLIFFTILAYGTALLPPLSAHNKFSSINQTGQLLPNLHRTKVQEGFRLKWISGYSPLISTLTQQLFKLPNAKHTDWFLIGHKVKFTGSNLNPKNFLSLKTSVKDIYTTRILSLFQQNQARNFEFDFDFSKRSFSTFIGTKSKYKTVDTLKSAKAIWNLVDNLGNHIRFFRTKISYRIITYFALADLSLEGSIKLNLDQTPVRTGHIILNRVGPGNKELIVKTLIDSNGVFIAKGLAPGFYKVSYLDPSNNLTQLQSNLQVATKNSPLKLTLNFKTKYKAQLSYKKNGEGVSVQGMLKWDNIEIGLPYGFNSPDPTIELELIPHFIGDFSSSVRLDRQGNPLTLPYADDNLDQLVFLSWNNQAEHAKLSGSYHNNQCSLKDLRNNRVYLTTTLKDTDYGPWRLKRKKIFINWSFSYQCGPTHGQDLQSIPLVGTPIGGVNELGEIQAEVTNKIYNQIKSRVPFSIQWNIIDPTDQGKIQVLLKMEPQL